ncbi:RICIN domain-containing protein [Allorhizocola rhizosphaerae]|uniref:RICIN domain-containing protein n=1 Tax=Allorhizocola rhizosphaerae TaxID=1872709 RepID=UPI0013C34A6C|nr:RICIN domain-containing protein [Allorhizocola rhizosphaerae]
MVTLAVGSVTASPAGASAAPQPSQTGAVAAADGPFHIYNRNSVNHGVNNCLAVPGASTGNVGLNQYWPCRYIDQWWYLEHRFTSGGIPYYYVRNVNSNMCMSVPAASLQPSLQVNQYPCGGYIDQYWGMIHLGNLNYAFRRYNTNLCLSVPGASTRPSEIVNQYPCGYYPDQYWYLSTSDG